MRELYEETGITENLMDVHKKFCKTLKYNTPKGPKECIYYLALVDDTAKVKLSSEHIDFKWLTISEIAEAHIYPDLHHMLEEGYNFIKHSRTLPMFPIKGCIYSA
ncbi:Bis(5'-nucleosyl)-tetraphosphatase [asymmetrical] [Thelohanellus kitauei]|uniref:Bis(5'-nucleosyl)-tetraphosphatase [asymmetrical] n=1 Tax=Thelohanellus kitauei TaxID=669202 RepID=A0A0C2JS11_THEKT|nr:Bis(5'-nucleosyl)-tetraphosphatase [asymmetrical] [Thelohanellus kitauei]